MNDLSPVRSELIEGGAICRLVLNQPKANILDAEMVRALTEAINEYGGSDTLRAFLITAEGPHFSFGASIEEHLPENVADMLSTFHDLFRALIQANRVTVCSVRGQCLGGGLELVLACGIVIAEDGATLASPEIQLGVLAPAATALLPTRVAEDVLLTGRSLTADDGLRLGIVSLVVPEGGLDEAVDTFVDTHFVPRSAHSLRLATRAVRGQRQVEVGERLDEAERLYVEELLPTHDGVEGIRAFMEKRPPQWRNC